MDEQTYEYIKQIKQYDDDEEEEENYPNGDGINDDDWVRLFGKSDYANSVVTIYPQEQVERNEKGNHIKINEKQKKESELVFKKYCRKKWNNCPNKHGILLEICLRIKILIWLPK